MVKTIKRFRSRKWQEGFWLYLKAKRGDLLSEEREEAPSIFGMIIGILGRILTPVYFFLLFYFFLSTGHPILALIHLGVAIYKAVRLKNSNCKKVLKAADRAGVRKMRGRR